MTRLRSLWWVRPISLPVISFLLSLSVPMSRCRSRAGQTPTSALAFLCVACMGLLEASGPVLTLWLTWTAQCLDFFHPQNGYILTQSSGESESVGWRALSRSSLQLWGHSRAWVWVFKTRLQVIYWKSLGQSLNLNVSVDICNRRTVTVTSWTCEDHSNDVRRSYWVLADCHGLCWGLSMNSPTSFSEWLGEV